MIENEVPNCENWKCKNLTFFLKTIFFWEVFCLLLEVPLAYELDFIFDFSGPLTNINIIF